MRKLSVAIIASLLLLCFCGPVAADEIEGEAQVSAFSPTAKVYTSVTLPYKYTLVKGDSLEKIAAKANVNVQNLMKLNGLTGYGLNAGTTIIVSQGDPAQIQLVTAKSGDTAESIAKSKGVSAGAVVNMNRLTSVSAPLSGGQILIIPRNGSGGSNPVVDGDMGELVKFALSFEGYPYVAAGKTPEEGFDCSGFVYYVYRHFGVEMPRVTTVDQCAMGVPVDKDKLQPGDLLGFGLNGSDYVRHTGIYVGDVDGDGGGEFIHAANSIRGVVVDNITMSYYVDNYICAARITLS